MRPDILRAGALAFACAVLLAACAPGATRGDADAGTSHPPLDGATASALLIAGYLEALQRLVQSPPAQQAEMLVAARNDYEMAPTPSRQLRYALALATPGHTETNLPLAQQLLRELMAAPETLLPAERALAFLELQKVDYQLTLEAENRRLQASASRADRERLAAANRQLQIELEKNAKLRKELEEARAKLDEIAKIERSISERNPNSEGRSP